VTLQDLLGVLVALGRLAAILALFLLLVVPHEAGHFALAKAFGVRVREFSVGMGTRLWSRVRGGTLYALRAIPLGGYVQLGGMLPDDYEDPQGFHAKPAHQRLLILLAGAGVNFLVAMVLITGVSFAQLNDDPGKVVKVFINGPAYTHGIRPGDSIRAVDGKAIRQPEDIRRAEDAKPGQALEFDVRRPSGGSYTAIITPSYSGDQKRYVIGIETATLVSPGQALTTGITFPIYAAISFGQGIYDLASGHVPGGVFGPNGLSSFVGFGYLAYHAAAEGLITYLLIVAYLSMALGLTNLLPLPALDGGRILVVLLEKLRGRPFDREREQAIQRYGLVALIALIGVAVFLDVQRIATGEFPGLR